jgi:exopolysaccharide biosynthesis WecB/TagA/CpsF family protein
MQHSGKKNVLGILVDAIDYEAAVARIVASAEQGRRCAVSALAVHGVMTGVLDPEVKYRLNRFELICPDGQPVRWALNLLWKAGLHDRVYGPFLTLRVCREAAARRLPVFLFGSSDEVLGRFGDNLRRQFPDIIVAGVRPSRFRRATEAEVTEDVAAIRASGARVVLVGLGCPRQEIWAYEMSDALSVPVLAVGAAFDFHAGSLAMAPKWMQDAGLEWLFRLMAEPRRLWKRYLYLNPLYLWNLLAQASGLKRFDPEDARAPAAPMRFG